MQSQLTQSISAGYLINKQFKSKNYTITDGVCFQKKILIPKQITIDKEHLYEELIKEKQKNQLLHNDLSRLKSRIICYEKELVIHNEMDYRKELKTAQIKLINKEEEMKEIMSNINYKKVLELEKKIQSLTNELQKYLIFKSFNYETECIINDNIELFKKVEMQVTQIKELDKIRAEYITISSKFFKLQQVLQAKDQELQKLRKRDPFQETHQKMQIKQEINLKSELKQKDDEIEHLKIQIAQQQKNINEDKKLIEELNEEIKSTNQMYENEKTYNKDKITQFQKEIETLQDKLKNFDKFMIQSSKRKTTLCFDELNQYQLSQGIIQTQNELITKSIQKSQVEDIVTELRLRLRNKNISLNQAEQILFKTSELSITELEQLFSHEPFKVMSCNTLARYMIEDYSEIQFEYDPNLKANTTQLKSIFKTLLQNYTLNFDQKIIEQVQKNILQIIENCIRKNITKLNKNGLIEQLQSLEIQWTSKHFDYFQQIYYTKHQEFLQFDLQNLSKLFNNKIL